MFKRMLTICFCIVLHSAGCAQLDETLDDDRVIDEGSSCAKCDSAIEGGEWASCWIEQGSLSCQLASEGVLLPSSTTVYAFDSAGEPLSDVAIHEPGARELFPVPAGAYPVTLQVGFVIPAENPVEGLTGQLFYSSAVIETDEATTAADPVVFTQPFDLWHMTVGGSGFNVFHFQAEPADIDILPFTSRTSGGDSSDMRVHRSFTTVGDQSQSFYWPVADSDVVEGAATVTTPDGGLIQDLPISFDEPGHYLIGTEGVEFTTLAEFVAAMQAAGEEEGEAEPPETDEDVDGEVETDPETEVDDCDGVCLGHEVCAGGACRNRSYQTSDSACDDDNGDCADDHICAAGTCQRRRYQTSDSVCDDDDNGDCADDYVCAAGTCQSRRFQTSDSVCDNDDNGDCAEDYVCAVGACQSRRFQTTDAACDDDTDCADHYSCVQGLCQR